MCPAKTQNWLDKTKMWSDVGINKKQMTTKTKSFRHLNDIPVYAIFRG